MTEDGKTVKATKALVVESSERILTEEMMIAEVGENGSIRKDKLNNPRYAGSDPNNYLCFGTQNEVCDEEHLYRIIGVIDGKVKIIKNSFYSTSKAWDTSNSDNWDRPSTLKTELNGPSFYENINYIDEISKSYIAEATWYTGGIDSNYTLADFEDNERSSSSIGYIGLMGVTDFGYASNNTGCERTTNILTFKNACINNNYLVNNITHQWTITRHSGNKWDVWYVVANGNLSFNNAYLTHGVYPVLYLESDVKITDGNGTAENPYCVSK